MNNNTRRATLFFLALCACNTGFAEDLDIKITRLLDEPIIKPFMHPTIGENVQGPSLIRVPDWVENPLGRYYLYFADHKGLYIRLAYADSLTGPWQIYAPGSLQIEDSFFPKEPAHIPDTELVRMIAVRHGRTRLLHTWGHELTQPHIASPDVHVDNENQRIIMYYHGLQEVARQHSRVATSTDGIHFTAREEDIGRTYFRVFPHDGMSYAISKPGQLYRSVDGLSNFEVGPVLLDPNLRHLAVLKRSNLLYVFWTRIGDAPESILLSTIDISGDWTTWRGSPEQVVLRPERDWEGARAAIEPSLTSSAYGMVNQLRDPAIYEEDGRIYLLYAVAGEHGIAIAEVELNE